ERRPAPTIRLPFDDHQRRSTLAAQREEHHQRQDRRYREYLAARVLIPLRFLQGFAQVGVANIHQVAVADLVGIHFPLLVNNAQRADHPLTGREPRQGRHADTPVPTQRLHRWLDRLPQLAQKTMLLPFAEESVDLLLRRLDHFIELFDLFLHRRDSGGQSLPPPLQRRTLGRRRLGQFPLQLFQLLFLLCNAFLQLVPL